MNAQNSDTGFVIAALGASAGGLEPLQEFFEHMPPDADIAFIVVQHLSPHHSTDLPKLLAKYTPMPVEQVLDNTKVARNSVYVIPPDATLTVKNDVLRLSHRLNARSVRTSIDSLFSSLAKDRAEHAVCILLSGTGTDGTLGLRAVKEYGGMAMAQSLETAQYDAMVRSAIGTGLVDHVLPVEEMPAQLLEYAAHLKSFSGTPNLRLEQIRGHLREVYGLIHRGAGHDFSQYDPNMLVRRMDRRIKALRIETVERYVELLERRPEEVDLLLRNLLIGVTRFFRDPEAFQALGREVIPKLFAGKGEGEPVRVCVVGCASGEEVYSIAILLCEHAATLASPPPIKIFATDIDERELQIARKGRYPATVAEHVTPERLERFFTIDDGAYQIKRELREFCIFATHSFIKDPPFSRLDLISCRNLMIYLGPDLQQRILALSHYALRSDGYLFLGPAEGAVSPADLFRPVDYEHRLFQRKETLRRREVTFPFGDFGRPGVGGNRPEMENHVKRLERIILRRHRPVCVAVRRNGDAVYFSGGVGRYIELTGYPDNNLLNTVREGLRIPLHTALHRASNARECVIQRNLPVQMDGGMSRVDLIVEPIPEFPNENLYMISFENSTPASGPALNDAPDAGSEDTIRRLETELRAAHQNSQAMYEEIRDSNEDLKSANEEYYALNEELEISHHEVQSFNAELDTLNSELTRKISELNHANSDLQNLLNGTQIAAIFLTGELRIRNFTPAVASLFPIISGDIGRPFSDLAIQISGADIVADINQVVKTRSALERQLVEPDGKHFQMRILPYRTVQNVIDGVVLTFTDVTRIKQSENALRESAAEYRAMFEASSVGVIEADPQTGRLRRVNGQFARLIGYAAAELTGKTFLDLTHPDDSPVNWEGFSRVVRGEIAFYEAEKRLLRKDGTVAWAHVTVNVVRDLEGRPVSVVAIVLDIGERKRAEALVACQKQTFEMFTSGAPLMEVLDFLARAAESQSSPGAAVAIHLLDESATRFEHTVGPSLPSDYSRAVDGVAVSSAIGPCCAAVSSRRRVAVADLAASDEFPAFTALLRPLGIRAYWSTPIIASTGRVLGTVVEYFYGERVPQPKDDLLGAIVTRTAAVIIERKRAEELQVRLAAIVDSSDDAIISKDLDGIIRSWNRGAERIFGYSQAEEVIGKPISILFPPGRENDMPAILSRISRGERIESFETERLTKDGRTIPVSLTVSPILDGSGRVIGASKVARDITERKRAEVALRESEERYRTLFESIDEGFCIIEMIFDDREKPVDYRFLQVSPSFEKQTGLRDVEGKTIREFAPAHEEYWFELYGRIALTGESVRAENHAGALHRWFDVYAFRFGKPENRQVAVLFNDITGRKQADRALLGLNNDLKHFAYAASHDLQEPLRMVMSFTQLLAKHYKGKLDPQADRFITYAVQGAERMETLLRDLREYWSVNERKFSEPVKVDCKRVLTKALDILTFAIRESGGVVTGDPLPTVLAEETPLLLLFQNLIGNALKYHRSGIPPRVHVSAEPGGGAWTFSVRDNGIGIEAEHLDKVFAPFKRLHGSEYAGSGIGLAICQRVVERYGGSIWVESEYGHGSTFRFTIPAPKGVEL
ncbi:MAG: PAS domain S-box protein [Bryobacteraceae bacterium]